MYNRVVYRVVQVRYQGQWYVVQEHYLLGVVLVKRFRYCAVRVPRAGLDSYASRQLALVLLQGEQCWWLALVLQQDEQCW